jgi:hypothetical protein
MAAATMNASSFVALRSPVWTGLIVSMGILGLLIAFHQVVRGAVRQGESRRMAVALHADALWRCHAMRDPNPRESCLAQLSAATDAASLNDPVSSARVTRQP